MRSLPPSKKLFQLKKIMTIRVRKAHRVYSEKQLEWNKLKNELDDLRAQFDVLQAELDKVAAYALKNKNNSNPDALVLASDRRKWLIYDQDLVKYNLDIADYDLEEATTELNSAKADWLRAQHREKNIGEQGDNALSGENQLEEALQEVEIEDLQLSGRIA